MENNNKVSIVVPPSPPQIPSQFPTEPKKKMKWWKKFLLGLVIFIVVAGVGIYFLPQILSMLFPGDAILADQSQVLLQKVSVPDTDNGFFDFSKINNCTSDNPTNCKSLISIADGFNSLAYTNYGQPVQWNQNAVDEALQNNQQALGLFDQAAQKNYFQIPDYSDPANIGINLKLYPLNDWREVSRLQAIKALSLSRQGKPDEALQEAVKISKVGHEIVDGHNNLIGTLVGISIQSLGSQTILHILPYGSSSKETLITAEEEVRNSTDNIEGYKNAFRFEYTHIANSIDETINTPLSEKISAVSDASESGTNYPKYFSYPYYYKPVQTKNLFTNLYAGDVSSVGQCQRDSQDAEAMLYNSQIIATADSWKKFFTENIVGKLLFSVTGLSLNGVITIECQTDLVTNVAQTELALKQYQIDNGALPASLNDLVPTYLSTVPLDPFDHQPIKYSAEKKIIYSVGIKKQDLGGSIGDNWLQMDNPTFQIQF